MILDIHTMLANKLAYGGTAETLDLQREHLGAGAGQSIALFVEGSGLTGATGITITDSADDSTYATRMTVLGSIVNGSVEFTLPSNVRRYVKIALSGTVTAGTWSCGVVLTKSQTAV